MTRHQLYEINLEHRTAFCTKCGYTEIVIPTTRTGKTLKPICSTRTKEILENRRQQVELAREARQSQPGWQLRHVLSHIDPVARTATCSHCGPTSIWKRSSSDKDKTYFVCGTQSREYERAYKRAHRSGRSTNPHALSQINEEAETAICATCGPVKIEIHLVNKYVRRRCINAGNPRRIKKSK